MIVEYEVKVPSYWKKHDIEYHRNESSWCSNNAPNELAEINGGICHCTEFEYLGTLYPSFFKMTIRE